MTGEITLADFAAEALSRLRDNFPAETLLEQQVMCVAEEAGEFLSAYRRWRGLARRTGTREELEAELADVLLAARVTAQLIDQDAPWDKGLTEARVDYDRTSDAASSVRLVYRAACGVLIGYEVGITCYDEPWFGGLLPDLCEVGAAATHAASALGIDLDAAWRAKAEHIMSRGWRENAAEVVS